MQNMVKIAKVEITMIRHESVYQCCQYYQNFTSSFLPILSPKKIQTLIVSREKLPVIYWQNSHQILYGLYRRRSTFLWESPPMWWQRGHCRHIKKTTMAKILIIFGLQFKQTFMYIYVLYKLNPVTIPKQFFCIWHFVGIVVIKISKLWN